MAPSQLPPPRPKMASDPDICPNCGKSLVLIESGCECKPDEMINPFAARIAGRLTDIRRRLTPQQGTPVVKIEGDKKP